jgi:hypothetical protein
MDKQAKPVKLLQLHYEDKILKAIWHNKYLVYKRTYCENSYYHLHCQLDLLIGTCSKRIYHPPVATF